jgi:hypothetical protein
LPNGRAATVRRRSEDVRARRRRRPLARPSPAADNRHPSSPGPGCHDVVQHPLTSRPTPPTTRPACLVPPPLFHWSHFPAQSGTSLHRQKRRQLNSESSPIPSTGALVPLVPPKTQGDSNVCAKGWSGRPSSAARLASPGSRTGAVPFGGVRWTGGRRGVQAAPRRRGGPEKHRRMLARHELSAAHRKSRIVSGHVDAGAAPPGSNSTLAEVLQHPEAVERAFRSRCRGSRRASGNPT